MRLKYFLYFFAAGTVLLSTGCKKYLDVNKNLNDPTVVPVSTLLTAAERSIGGNFALGTGLGNGLGAYTHQITGRASFDRYSMTGPNMDGAWFSLYAALSNVDVIIEQGTAEGRLAYAGVAKILKAYTFSMMVDIWGDIPYTDFNQFKAGVKQPKFDDDATIYPKLIALLDEGIADINNPAVNPSKPGADDVIYGGNTGRWIKAANTIKLKMYTQMRLVQNVSAQVTALLANPAQLINAQNESFLLPFGPFGATDDRYPGYGDYTGTQRGGQLPSPWLYEMMKGLNPAIYAGVTDPRIPYYMYNQKTATGVPENRTEYRDGGYISIVFGSSGPYRDGSNSNTYTLLGIYPVGGRYDDGAGTSISGTGPSGPATAGTGAAPQRMLTYADRLYLEAELINVGLAPGNARNVFSAALDASFAQIDYVITTYIKSINQTVPAIATLPTVTTYKTDVLAAYDAGSTARKLEHIMTQKWLSRFGNSVDNYTDYRRTGYPIMFDPNNPAQAPGGFVQPPINGNFQVIPQEKIPVANPIAYPLSLPWSQSEIEFNSNAPAQKTPATYKVFWKP
ncbi:SusD/RagB family nutrient-binding outer membrane lipoprotein [Chitinophagaceae bacterium IBVUCB2]|nr:SusD/RagB family nutrient-binding outer membrane lipoprotein [Chitinophagaceae bacterium IBVUCB2]